MIDKEEMLAEFCGKPARYQAALLLRVCYNLTLMSRDIAIDPGQSPRVEAGKTIVELFHRLTPNILVRVTGGKIDPPDEALVGMIYDFFVDYALERYFSVVWVDAVDRTKKSPLL